METTALVVIAALYAVVNGLNDGGALIGAAIRRSRLRPLAGAALLGGALVLVPLVAGAPVAETLADRLVDFTMADGARALGIAVVVAIGVTGALAWAGLPTSLTLATVGGFVGVGLGSPLTVAGAEVVRVLVLAALAPLVGGLVAVALMAVLRLPRIARRGRIGAGTRVVTSTLTALAYAANDGQKMIAVGVIAVGGGATRASRPGALLLVGLAAAFVLGTLAGMRRSGFTLGHGVLAARTTHLTVSELSAATAVTASGWLGAPVSMTQSLAGSLAGSGVTDGMRRVRWRLTARLVLAWVVTFPAALGAAALAAALLVGGPATDAVP